MKKLTVIVLALALVICLGTVSAFAAGSDNGAAFVDANNDGVCDNLGNGTGRGNGAAFVDANNDGVCDNLGNGTGRGSSAGQGCGLRGGCRK